MLNDIVLLAYLFVLGLLSLYGLHRYWILFLYWKYYKMAPPLPEPPPPAVWPVVTVQLPVYNERYVVERLIDSICALDYPQDRLEIQVLDDSTDETREIVERKVAEKRALGHDIACLHRPHRRGYKAGALSWGLQHSRGEFVAIFDADFVPTADFLLRTVTYFQDERLGMVQTRWGHINANYSLLTRVQSLFLDGHFLLEHTARNRSGAFFNFNGTAGVWRRRTIIDAGGWMSDTLTEDLDLSYRAQLRNWKFLFLPEVVCPAELPVDIGAFRSQQHRWTKGALQVAKKILPMIWKSDVPFAVKAESTVHLTAGIGYGLVLLLSFLLLPSLIARRGLEGTTWVNAIEIVAFFTTTISVALFYITAQHETHRSRVSLRELPALMAFGIGMAVNNTRAIWEAVCDIPTEFRRTAKYNVRDSGDAWRHKKYRTPKSWRGLMETGIAGYLVFALFRCFTAATWMSMPFVGLFLFGYIYVGVLTLAHAIQKT